jgi:hypothetical protein
LDWRGAAECQVEQGFEVTPVGGFAALVVDRSPEPESSAADQDRHVIELLADSLNWARREDPQIVRPTSARRGRSEDPRLLEARSSDPPALERVAFGLRRQKGNGADGNLLQKIRNGIKLAP